MDRGKLDAFASAYESDPAFKSRIDAADSVEDLIAIAREQGFAITAADVLIPDGHDLDDAELEDVSGGTFRGLPPTFMCEPPKTAGGRPSCDVVCYR